MRRKIIIRTMMTLVMAVFLQGQNCAQPAGGGGGGGGNLVGVWEGQYFDPTVGQTVVDLTIQSNGQFTETYQSASNLTYITGPWIPDFAGTPGLLRLNVADYYPKEFCGPLGCNTIQPIAGESWFYSFFDGGNTLQLVNYYCNDPTLVNCTIVHRRLN